MGNRTFLASLGLDDVPYATVDAVPSEWLNGAHKSVAANLPEEIHDGQERWRHLLSLAGTLRARGLGEAVMVEQLDVFNRNHCRPPKPHADVRRIAAWVMEHDSTDGLGEGPPKTSSWAPVDLAAVADGSAAEEPPSVLARTDGEPLLYRRKRHLLAGEPESGKGWVAMAAAAPEITARRNVLYLDFENTATTALERLEALGVGLMDVLEHFVYVRPDTPPDTDLGELAADAVLAVVDGVTEAMNLLGLNPYDNRDVAGFLTKIARPLADAGAAVLLIDHVVKDRDNRGRWAIGAQHKMAGVDVSFSLEVIRPFGRGLTGGLSRLTVQKDRPGFLRQHAAGRSRLGDVHMDSDEGGVSVRIEPAQDSTDAGFRPTVLMERVSRYLETRGEQTKNAIESDVRGRAEYVRAALVTLESEGFITRRDGPRNSALYVSTKPYRESEG